MGFLQLLVKKGIITDQDIDVLQKESEAKEKSIEQLLVDKGIKKTALLSAKAEYYEVPSVDLNDKDIPFETLNYIPEESAVHYKVVPIALHDSVLEVGVVDPDSIETMDALNFIASRLHVRFKLFVITEADFIKILTAYKGFSGEVTKALTDLETELSDEGVEISGNTEEKKAEAPGVNIIEDAPVTKIVATILRYAIDGGGSDVHIEPMRDKVRVRFRVDGVLNTSLILPIKVHSAVTARIKILADMKLDEKRKPQDGRFSAKIEGRKIDFRVSTFPTHFGEKIVMRILDQEKGVKKIEEIGFSARNLAMVKIALEKPYGLILITGPTGSGKSTTLYSMLNGINKEEKNVLSLEDPIEYNIDGISQSQVHPEIDYTFATGLRTTLRQDPDVIMVGEIRDKETAQLAIQAALTGHLVFSTIHTNTALGVIPRLVDMGVDPYLIAPTLALVIGQRLVSKIAPGIGKCIPIDDSIKMMLDKQFEDLPEQYRKEFPPATEFLGAEFTPEYPKGTHGRLAVFEMFEMSKELEKAILEDPNEPTLKKVVRSQGMLTMKEDAIIKAMEKKIPFEEINTL